MRSGRLDRKIEFPHPTEEARGRILQVLYPLLHLFFFLSLFLCRFKAKIRELHALRQVLL